MTGDAPDDHMNIGINPRCRIASISTAGNALYLQGLTLQFMKGAPKGRSDIVLLTMFSNCAAADMSHGGSPPVNCDPTHAPQ